MAREKAPLMLEPLTQRVEPRRLLEAALDAEARSAVRQEPVQVVSPLAPQEVPRGARQDASPEAASERPRAVRVHPAGTDEAPWALVPAAPLVVPPLDALPAAQPEAALEPLQEAEQQPTAQVPAQVVASVVPLAELQRLVAAVEVLVPRAAAQEEAQVAEAMRRSGPARERQAAVPQTRPASPLEAGPREP